MSELKSARATTFEVLDKMPVGTIFKGIHLAGIVNNKIGEVHYPASYLRYLRAWRSRGGRVAVNIHKRKSIYEIREVG